MATTAQLIYDVHEDLSSYQVTDDTDIDDRQIIYKYNNQRALWLRNEYNKKGRTIDPFVVQSLGCVDLEVADSAECPELPVGCSLLRTTCEIPKTVEFHNRTGITKVGAIDKLDYFFSFVSYQQAIFAGNGKFNGKSIFAFINNNRMYFKFNNIEARLLRKVNIMGVFEDPTAVAEFCNEDGTSCFSMDDEYPLSTWMVPYIHEEVLRQFTRGMKMPEDNANDAKSNEDQNV